MLLSFGACGNEKTGGVGRDTSGREPGGADMNSSEAERPPEASAASEVQPGENPGDTGEALPPVSETLKYAQQDGQEELSNAKAYLTLNPDGSFVLEIQAYDGMPKITGSYVLENDVYRLENLETASPLFDMTLIKSMSFAINGENLIYQGDQLEQTISGAEFIPYN